MFYEKRVNLFLLIFFAEIKFMYNFASLTLLYDHKYKNK